MKRSIRGALAAFLLLAVPTAHAVTNEFDFEVPLGSKETFLISETRNSSGQVYIVYFLTTLVKDTYVKVTWKDKNGTTLMQGDSSQWQGLFSGFPEPGDEIGLTWGKRLGAIGVSTREAEGNADFTGSIISANSSCPSSLANCKPPVKYLESASPFGSNSTLAPQGSRLATLAATPLDYTEGRLEVRTYAGSPIAVPDDFTTQTAIVFTSSVAQDGAGYVYTYSAMNQTDQTLPFNWEGAALAGELNPAINPIAERTFTSTLPPARMPSLATITVFGEQAGGGLEILSPVPEPSSWVLLLAGIASVGWQCRRTVISSFKRQRLPVTCPAAKGMRVSRFKAAMFRASMAYTGSSNQDRL